MGRREPSGHDQPTRAETVARSAWPGLRQRAHARRRAPDVGLQWVWAQWGDRAGAPELQSNGMPAQEGSVDTASGMRRVAVYASYGDLLATRLDAGNARRRDDEPAEPST